ncbi:MAG: hypothetical protein ACRCYX_00005, partial [Dermatophilaceae bacterium]
RPEIVLQTSFEAGQLQPPSDGLLTSIGVVELCCDTGGLEAVRGTAGPGGTRTGEYLLLYSGQAFGPGPASAASVVVTPPRALPVGPGMTLSWWVWPERRSDADAEWISTSVGLDLQFTDGTFLSELRPTRTDGAGGRPHDLPLTVVAGRWQQVSVEVGEVAEGRTVRSVVLAFDGGTQDGPFRGFIDDIEIRG